MRIAVIGTGIAGMGAAAALAGEHELTVYERDGHVGGHSRTIDVSTASGTVPVDTGFIVFNQKNYPRLTALFERLKVPVAPSCMSFGVSINGGWMEYGTRSLTNLFAQKRNLLRPQFRRMIRDILRFNKEAKPFVQAHPEASLAECLAGLKMGEWFRRYYLLAMGGAIWSTSQTQMLSFPARTMVQFFENHGLLTVDDHPQWYTVKGGSREYVRRLVAPFEQRIHLNRGVAKVVRGEAGVAVIDVHGVRERYDQVVFACHSDEALALIEEPTRTERALLGAIRFQANRIILHQDPRYMPRRKKAWSSWVYVCNDRRDDEPLLSLSYWLNNLQPLDTDEQIFVSMNPSEDPEPALIHDRCVCHHPVFDQAAIAAQGRLGELQGEGGLWFCGAWQNYGFHEDGLESATRLVARLNERVGAPVEAL